MRKLQLFMIAVILIALPAGALCAEVEFRSVLTGKNEVPRVKTPARGKLTAAFANGVFTYKLTVEGVKSPTAANIHRGGPGQNGPVVARLLGEPSRRGPFSGILAEGTLTAKNLVGELQGKTLADLVRLMEAGRAYVNVLTETFPAGEIRGKIRRK